MCHGPANLSRIRAADTSAWRGSLRAAIAGLLLARLAAACLLATDPPAPAADSAVASAAALAPRMIGFGDGQLLALSHHPRTRFFLGRAGAAVRVAALPRPGLGVVRYVAVAGPIVSGAQAALLVETEGTEAALSLPRDGLYAVAVGGHGVADLRFECDADRCELPAASLAALVAAHPLPSRVLQADLAHHPKTDQRAPELARRLGSMGCGIVAAATPYQRAAQGVGLDVVGALLAAAGLAFDPATGIQPRGLTGALHAVLDGVTPVAGFPGATDHVRAMDRGNLVGLYQALLEGRLVIVDLLFGRRAEDGRTVERPSPLADGVQSYAHFARVLGIDVARGELYLENTLLPVDEAYVAVSFDRFLAAWEFPERDARAQPRLPAGLTVDPVTRWAALIDREARPRWPAIEAVDCGRRFWRSTCLGDVLLRCDAAPAQRTECPDGCAVRPFGEDDACIAAPLAPRPH